MIAPSLVPVVLGVGLSKAFGATRALQDVSIEVLPAEVRALVGRNGAGKSTLVSLLTGLVEPDAGTLQFGGSAAPAPQAREQWQSKVACVYQHSKLIPTLSCAENLFLCANMRSRKLLSWRVMRREARATLMRWGMDIDVDSAAGSLDVGQRQLLEIARALTQGARFLILDEPTAKLEGREVDRLFEQIRVLQTQGVGVLFISHHLDEVFEICGSVTVLRDGLKTLDRSISGLSREALIEAMIGAGSNARAVAPVELDSSLEKQPIRLAAYCLSRRGAFEPLSFEVRRGECLGLTGLTGSGKEAVGEVIAGLRSFDSGELRLDGVELPGGDVRTHNLAGVGFVPRDRHHQGLVLNMSVAENAAMTLSERLGSWGFIRSKSLDTFAGRMIRSLDIKAASPSQPVAALSGGNQQKVVLARALARNPSVLVLINPTCGVDVASKATLFDAIAATVARGSAVVLISDELEELELCHRLLVFRARRLTREFCRPWSTQAVVAEMEGISE